MPHSVIWGIRILKTTKALRGILLRDNGILLVFSIPGINNEDEQGDDEQVTEEQNLHRTLLHIKESNGKVVDDQCSSVSVLLLKLYNNVSTKHHVYVIEYRPLVHVSIIPSALECADGLNFRGKLMEKNWCRTS